jgi:putative transposase
LGRDPPRATVAGLCGKVGISRQAFYKEKKDRQRKCVEKSAIIELVKIQRKIHPRMGGRKLYNLIQPDFNEMHLEMGRDRFYNVLREADLLIKRRSRSVRTTYSNHDFRVYPNLVRRIDPSMPDQVWVSDLTYIRTDESFMYLSLITDAFSRKIVGYDISDRLEVSGCLGALRKAISSLPKRKYPIHHSDRGTQYCCQEYVNMLKRRGIAISMTESNHCYENAKAERVNGILKQEYLLGLRFRTKEQAIEATRQAVKIYNEMRPHMSLNYMTPSNVHSQVAA